MRGKKFTPQLAEFHSFFSKRRVIITGADGFIGGHLRDVLVSLNAKVYGINRNAKANINNYKGISTDLSNLKDLQSAIDTIQPEIIFHLAGKVTGRQNIELVYPTLQDNLIGTINLLLASSNNTGIRRIITVGSAEETINSTPNSPYSVSKTAVALYTKMFHQIYSLPIVTAKLFMVYGPHQQEDKLIPYSIISLLKGKFPQITSKDRLVDLIYISDVVRGLLLTATYPGIEGQTFEFGTGESVKIKQIIKTLTSISGNATKIKAENPIHRIQEKNLVANINKTKKILGWVPEWTLRDGLWETFNWYQKHLI